MPWLREPQSYIVQANDQTASASCGKCLDLCDMVMTNLSWRRLRYERNYKLFSLVKTAVNMYVSDRGPHDDLNQDMIFRFLGCRKISDSDRFKHICSTAGTTRHAATPSDERHCRDACYDRGAPLSFLMCSSIWKLKTSPKTDLKKNKAATG